MSFGLIETDVSELIMLLNSANMRFRAVPHELEPGMGTHIHVPCQTGELSIVRGFITLGEYEIMSIGGNTAYPNPIRARTAAEMMTLISRATDELTD